MGDLIVPGESPEAAAERRQKEANARREAEIVETREKLVAAANDPVALSKLLEKSEYWRDKAGKELAEAGGVFEPAMYRMFVRSNAMQDMLDIIDPSGVMRKQYEILFNVHGKQFFENVMEQLPAMKERQASAEAQAFLQQQAFKKGNGRTG